MASRKYSSKEFTQPFSWIANETYIKQNITAVSQVPEYTESKEARAPDRIRNKRNGRTKREGSLVHIGKVFLNKVASFFGIRDGGTDMQLWKERFTDRAKAGQIGINTKDIIPTKTECDSLKCQCRGSESHSSLVQNGIEMTAQPSHEDKNMDQEHFPLLQNHLPNQTNLSSASRTESDSSLNQNVENQLSLSTFTPKISEYDKTFHSFNNSRNLQDSNSNSFLRNHFNDSDVESENETSASVYKNPKIPGMQHFKFIDDPLERISAYRPISIAGLGRPNRNKESKRKPFIPISGEVTSRVLSNTTLELQAEPVNLTPSYRSLSREMLNSCESEEDLRDKNNLCSLRAGGSYRETSQKKHEDRLDEINLADSDDPQSCTKAWLMQPINLFLPSRTSIWRRFHNDEQIIKKLQELPEFSPWFIYGITFVQALILAVSCCVGTLAHVSFSPVELTRISWINFTQWNIHYWESSNMWIGPPPAYLITVGAIFAPCMRSDYRLLLLISQQDFKFNLSSSLGCCEKQIGNVAGLTTEAECKRLNETNASLIWHNITCNKRPPGDNSIADFLKPCCLPFTGQCVISSHETCVFLNGYFHRTGSKHCREINCLSNICGLGGIMSDADLHYFPNVANQWWRILIAPVISYGIFYFLTMAILQWIVGRPIEKMAGFVRIALIYSFSSIGGHMFAVLINPYSIQMGAGSAVSGLLGVQTVELIQSYKLLRNPKFEILKLVIVFLLVLLIGTFPLSDNTSHFGGFIFGVFLAILLLPYITFNHWEVTRRRILMIISIPILILLYVVEFVLFYQVQIFSSCSYCKYMNCIPYKKHSCLYSWDLLDSTFI